MKRTALFGVSALALLAMNGGVRADSGSTGPVNPYEGLDPDGVPLAVTHPQHVPTAQEMADQRQAAAQDARDRDWLMINYEQQVRRHLQDSADKEAKNNLYLQLTLDKDLGPYGGLGALETPEPPATAPSLHAAPTPEAEKTTVLRPEAPASPGAFTPLVRPLSSWSTGATETFSISTYAAPIPSILAPERGGELPVADPPSPAKASSSHSTSYSEVMDLQTPGMVAAKNDPLGQTEMPDLTLDALAGETQEQAEAKGKAPMRAELPQVMDADQLHQEQSAKLQPPDRATTTKTASSQPPTAAQPKIVPVNPEDAPVPVTQQPQLNPVHAPIGNPYDILNR